MPRNDPLWDFLADLPATARWPDSRAILSLARERFGDFCPLTVPVAITSALSGEGQAAVPLGAAFAMLYLAAELLDDFQDQDTRERPWSAWPLDRVLTASLSMIFISQACLARLRAEPGALREIPEQWAEVGVLAAVGQNALGRPDSLPAYLEHIAAKSGVIFSAGAWAAARLVTAEAPALAAARDFGLAFGMLLQLRDDLDDYVGAKRPEQADGFLNTLPVVYAREKRLLSGLPASNEPIAWDAMRYQALRERIDGAGGRVHALGVLKVYERKALEALGRLTGEGIPYLAEYIVQTAGGE